MLISCFFIFSSSADAINSAISGNWNNPATWTGGIVPTAGATAVILTGHTVTVTVDAACSSLTLNAPATNNAVNINTGITLNVGGAVTMNAPSAGVITSTIAVGSGILKAASLTIPGSATASRFCTVSVSTGTIEVSGNIAFSGTAAQARLISTGASTIKIGGNLASGGTLTTSGTGQIIFNGSVAQTMGVYTTYNNIVISNTSGGVQFLAGTTTITGNITVETGTLDITGVTLNVNRTTKINNGGTISLSTNTTGTKTFIGEIIIDDGGRWNNPIGEGVTLRGGITNNGTFEGGTGTYTFTTTAQQFRGSNKLTFGGILTITAIALTSNTIVEMTGTAAGQLAGTGSFINSATGTLYYKGSTNTVTTFNSTAVGNTVVYNSATTLQTIRSTIYENLIIDTPSQSPQIAGGTIQSTGSMIIDAGTLDVRGVNITVNGPTTIKDGGTLTFTTSTTGTKTFNGPITIESGGTLTGAVGETITINNGGILNYGTFNGGTSIFSIAGGITNYGIFNGGTAAKTLRSGGITNHGSFYSGTGTYTFNTNTQELNGTQTITFEGIATVPTPIVLTCNTTLDFNGTAAGRLAGTGTFILSAGNTLYYAGSTITTTTVNFAESGSTVIYDSATTGQIVRGSTYEKLIIDKPGLTATLGAATIIQSTGGLIVRNGTLNLNTLNFTNNAITTIESGGTINDSSTTGVNTFAGLIINEGSWTSSGSDSYTIQGGIINNGSFSSGTGLYTFDTNDQRLNANAPWTITSMSIADGIVVYNNSDLSIITNIAGTGTLSQEAGAVLNIKKTGASVTANIDATAPGNIVNHNSTAAQTIKVMDYQILKVNNPYTTGASLGVGTTRFNKLVIGDEAAGSIFTDTGQSVEPIGNSNLEMISGRYRLTTAAAILPAFNTYTLSSATTIEYAAATAQKVYYGQYQDLSITGASTKTLTEDAFVNGSFIVASGSTFTPDVNKLTGSINASMNISGYLYVPMASFEASYPGFGIRTFNSNSTANYAMSDDQEILDLSYGNLILSGAGVKTLAGESSVLNNLTVSSPVMLAPNGQAMTGNGALNALTVNGTVNVDAPVFTDNYSGFETITLTGSTVDYLGNDQAIADLNYVNLSISNTGTKSLGANESITGILNVKSGTTFECSAYIMGVALDLIADGTISGSNTLALSGASRQISGSGIINIPVTVTNAKTIPVSATLTFLQNVILNGGAADTTNNGIVTVEAILDGVTAPSWVNAAGSFLDIKGPSFLATSGNMLCSANPNTVRYLNKTSGTTIKTGTYFNLVIDIDEQTAVQNTAVTCNGDLTLLSGTVNSSNTTTVAGTTDIFGTLLISSTTGTQTFSGPVIIRGSGTWNNTGNEAVTMRNGLTNYGTFNSGTGLYTFDTNSQRLFSSDPWTIRAITVPAPLILSNNSDLTIVTDIAGTGTFSQEAGAILNISKTGAAITALLDASASDNTVSFNASGAQVLSAIPEYENIKISGTGTKTLGADVTINRSISIESTLDTGANSYSIAVKGDWINNGTFTARNGIVTFDGASAQTIYGDNSWQKLSITATNARTVFFESDKTQSILAGGSLLLQGSNYQPLTLAPSIADQQWYLNVSGTGVSQAISNVNVSYSNAGTPGFNEVIDASNFTNSDGGNSINWRFPDTSGGFLDFL